MKKYLSALVIAAIASVSVAFANDPAPAEHHEEKAAAAPAKKAKHAKKAAAAAEHHEGDGHADHAAAPAKH